MNTRNDLIWSALWNSETSEYEPQRQARRFSRADNSFADKAQAQAECDRKNSTFIKPSPLQLIPDRTPIINPLT